MNNNNHSSLLFSDVFISNCYVFNLGVEKNTIFVLFSNMTKVFFNKKCLANSIYSFFGFVFSGW